MVSKPRKKPPPRPFYHLSEVRRLVQDRQVLIRGNALAEARKAFGWNSDDILDAVGKLQVKHFYKTDVSRHNRLIVLDFYRARGLKGENIYTHFYINDETGKLIVNSFKEI